MAEVGGMLAYAMLKVVTQQIGSIIGGQLKLQWDFSDDLRKMKMTLDSMEAVLQDAERLSIRDAAVRLWLKRLRARLISQPAAGCKGVLDSGGSHGLDQ